MREVVFSVEELVRTLYKVRLPEEYTSITNWVESEGMWKVFNSAIKIETLEYIDTYPSSITEEPNDVVL